MILKRKPKVPDETAIQKRAQYQALAEDLRAMQNTNGWKWLETKLTGIIGKLDKLSASSKDKFEHDSGYVEGLKKPFDLIKSIDRAASEELPAQQE